jgi:hypothetical protein
MKYLVLILTTTLLLGGSGGAMAKASAAMKAGMYKEALGHISVSQQTDMTNPDIYRMKALLHEALDEPNHALIAWQYCLKYSKNKILSSEAKVHIESLSQE